MKPPAASDREIAYPQLPDSYAGALREAAAYIFERFQPLVVLAAGTIVRGTPDPTSDLDLYVLHAPPWRQRVQKFFKGVPAEIFVNPPQQVERYLEEEQAEARPITAHMLATGFVMLDNSDGILPELCRKAAELLAAPPLADPQELVNLRYMAAARFEDARDRLEIDPETGAMILSAAVREMLPVFFRARGLFIPREKDLLPVLDSLDPELGALARAFFRGGSISDRLNLAEEIAARTIQARGFFEWESARRNT
jgi:hypothetical protein